MRVFPLAVYGSVDAGLKFANLPRASRRSLCPGRRITFTDCGTIASELSRGHKTPNVFAGSYIQMLYETYGDTYKCLSCVSMDASCTNRNASACYIDGCAMFVSSTSTAQTAHSALPLILGLGWSFLLSQSFCRLFVLSSHEGINCTGCNTTNANRTWPSCVWSRALTCFRPFSDETYQESWAIFTQYPTAQHTEAAGERETHANIEVLDNAFGAGVREQFNAVGNPLDSAKEVIKTNVKSGTYEDSEMPCDVKPNLQMKVRVGVVRELTGTGYQRGKFQLLDVKNISGNKVLVLRSPRLEGLFEYKEIDWPCSGADICNIQVSTAADTPPSAVGPAWEPPASMAVEASVPPAGLDHSGPQNSTTSALEVEGEAAAVGTE